MSEGESFGDPVSPLTHEEIKEELKQLMSEYSSTGMVYKVGSYGDFLRFFDFLGFFSFSLLFRFCEFLNIFRLYGGFVINYERFSSSMLFQFEFTLIVL